MSLRWRQLRTLVHVEADRERVVHLNGMQSVLEEQLAQIFDQHEDLMIVTLRWKGTKSKRKPDDRYKRGA